MRVGACVCVRDTILPALYQGRDVVATVTAAGGLEGKKWEGEAWSKQ